MILKDFPKIESPFVRVVNEKGDYVVTPKINEGYDWVINDEGVIASEKLHGTCCAVVVENGTVVALYNRTNRIPFIGGVLSKAFTEGVNNAVAKDRLVLQDGIHWGELIGQKFHNNPYQIEEHEWLPFEWIKEHLAYKSFHKHPKTFEGWNEWFKELQPLYCWKIHGKEKADADKKYGFVEGIVFVQPSTGKMVKLRRDMWSWYIGRRHPGMAQ